MHLLGTSIVIFSNLNDLLDPEKVDELHSITITCICWQFFISANIINIFAVGVYHLEFYFF